MTLGDVRIELVWAVVTSKAVLSPTLVPLIRVYSTDKDKADEWRDFHHSTGKPVGEDVQMFGASTLGADMAWEAALTAAQADYRAAAERVKKIMQGKNEWEDG